MKDIFKKYFTAVALIWICCFVVLFIVYILALSPQRKSQVRIEQDLLETRLLYESIHQATTTQAKSKLISQIEQLRNNLGDFVIDYENLANLTFDISRMATEQKLASFSIKTRNDFSGAASSGDKHLRQDRIELQFAAGFNQFARFLSALERHRPVVFVDDFSITRSSRGHGRHQVSMNLGVFVKKSPAG